MDEQLVARVDALAREVARLHRRQRAYVAVIAGLVAVAALEPAVGEAAHGPRSLDVVSSDGKQVLHLTPAGLEVQTDGKTRAKLEVGPDWTQLGTYAANGDVTWSVGTDKSGTAMKIYSPDAKLRVEVAEQLIDSGAGVRLYDRAGFPRATFYADQRQGQSGLELTDANRQPRIDVYAEPDGISGLRATNSDATSSAELSVLPRSDVWSRNSGMVPEPQKNEPLLPMLYLSDARGSTHLETPSADQ